MLWVAIMFTALELDRANLSQAVADNFLADMNLSTNGQFLTRNLWRNFNWRYADYNLGNSVYALSFLAGEFPSQLLAKWIGPDRYIPVQIILFSIVSASQFSLNSRASFLACRSLLALLQGGFIPEVCIMDRMYNRKGSLLWYSVSYSYRTSTSTMNSRLGWASFGLACSQQIFYHPLSPSDCFTWEEFTDTLVGDGFSW